MHKYKFILGKQQHVVIYLDKEELVAGECVVVGSTVYKVNQTARLADEVIVSAEKISDKLYIGLLSEW